MWEGGKGRAKELCAPLSSCDVKLFEKGNDGAVEYLIHECPKARTIKRSHVTFALPRHLRSMDAGSEFAQTFLFKETTHQFLHRLFMRYNCRTKVSR
ncbi:hypothetical protein HBI04_026760 [Parastagonospora nodorum]|nr:hypothetical protein HBH51_110540 [Parastagonospora nodorum]KAH4199051.1 hypothetical protein HBH42_052430 [Parastagonospora nodorum]KAH4271345.1 hypothetical protein HBI03_031910 [Parastagonospora nodorum]KAH4282080.1 hypothetical protein HBI04_026760 [Parastagonospora nodorum]KAH4992351.1 hypothetical protein HBI76_044690 [Parastagonospora nodorum]